MTFTTRAFLMSSALMLTSISAGAQRMNLVEGKEVLAFARGLASEYSFVDLAAEVLAEGEKRGFPSSMSEQVAIEKCDIFSIGALAMRDPVRRHELFEEALQAYTDFIDQNSRSEALPDAEAGFVQTSAQYAQSIQASLEEAKGEEAEKLRLRRIEILTNAVSRTGNLIEKLRQLEEPREADKRRLFDLMLNRGRMLTETAISQEDPTFSFEQANSTLEELSFDAGEGSPYSLRAFDAMGNNKVAQGQPEEAAYMFQYVVDSAIPMDQEAWAAMVDEQGLTQADKDTRWLFVELSTKGLVESWSEAGDLESALSWAMHFYNTQKREGFTLSVSGYYSMLQVARALIGAGGYIGGNTATGTAQWFATEEAMKEAGHVSSRNQRSATDLALAIAQTVKDDNRGNTLQVRAQKLIKDIISQPGVKKSPDVLLDAAMGEYNEGNWDEAIDAFKDVLDAVSKEDDATRARFGPDLMYYLGRCYRGQDRELEATLCFKEGITTFKGNEVQNAQNAKGFLAMAKLVAVKVTGEDDAITALKKDAEQAIIKYGGGDTKDALLFSRAEKARQDKNYDEAIGLYEQIEPGSDYYEKALVNVGICRLRSGDPDAAIGIFDGYLNDYVTDPKNAIAQSETHKTRRREAKASAEFYRGYIYFKRAENKPGTDPNWPKVVELLANYYTDYEEQTRLAPATMRMVAFGHLAQSDVAASRGVLDAMLERFPESQYTGSVAIEVYKKLKSDRDAADAAGDTERSLALLREMADLIHSGNATSSSPSFDNLRNESKHWMELGQATNDTSDWEKAERVLTTLRDKFSTANAEDMEKYVLPDLAEAYMRMRRVNDALEVLLPLNAEGKRPSKQVVVHFSRAITGWVEENAEGRIQVVPGATEDPTMLETACGKLLSIRDSAELWSGEWCEYQFDTLYGYYVWSKLNSVKLDTLKSFVAKMLSDAGGDSQFLEVEKAIKAGGGERNERLGDNVLRKRFVWLNQKVGS